MDFTIDAIECNRRKQDRDFNAAGVWRSSNTNFHTPIQQNTSSSSSGYQPRAVTNPYSKSSSNVTSNNNTSSNFPRGGTNTEIRNDDSSENVALPYASDMMMQGVGTTYVTDRETSSSQHPHRGGRVRNQRQFGTSIGVSSSLVGPSAGRMMTDDLRRCMTAFTPGFTQPSNTSNTDNDGSDNSSTSSDDDALLSFDIFQKK